MEPLRDVDDSHIQKVFEHINWLLTSGGVMAAGAAVAKFNKLISPTFPMVSIVAGTLIAFAGVGLTAWAVSHGFIKIGFIYQSRVKGLLYGGLYAFLGISMAMALFFAATSA